MYIFCYIYFNCVLLNKVELCYLSIGIIILLTVIVYIIINLICLYFNLKYIKHFLNKINIDFERNKCDSIWIISLNIIEILLFLYYLSIIVYKFYDDDFCQCCSSCICSCNCCTRTKEPNPPEPDVEIIPYTERRTEENKKKCIKCLTNERNVILYPCKHKVVCQSCFNNINSAQTKKCPFCRTIFTDGIDIDHVYDP